MCEGDEIGPGDLPYGIKHNAGQPASEERPSHDAESLKSEVLNLERDRIVRALKESDFVQSRAARLLGITPRQLGYRIKKYRIETPR
ncbi:MAG: helix-turn-helix domain-containing protein [Nitrospirota bacterium]